ncbi:hypothetical protein C8R45DRAFT_935201 [Mycena sanguinolenta]|nr:hypothetical protein C8R45DRAFT_935201 [Mycena sanguinolenta]
MTQCPQANNRAPGPAPHFITTTVTVPSRHCDRKVLPVVGAPTAYLGTTDNATVTVTLGRRPWRTTIGFQIPGKEQTQKARGVDKVGTTVAILPGKVASETGANVVLAILVPEPDAEHQISPADAIYASQMGVAWYTDTVEAEYRTGYSYRPGDQSLAERNESATESAPNYTELGLPSSTSVYPQSTFVYPNKSTSTTQSTLGSVGPPIVSRRERERGSDANADKVGIKIVVITSTRYRIYTKIVYEILEIWEEVMATGIKQIREDGPGIPQRRLRQTLLTEEGAFVMTAYITLIHFGVSIGRFVKKHRKKDKCMAMTKGQGNSGPKRDRGHRPKAKA